MVLKHQAAKKVTQLQPKSKLQQPEQLARIEFYEDPAERQQQQ